MHFGPKEFWWKRFKCWVLGHKFIPFFQVHKWCRRCGEAIDNEDKPMYWIRPR